MVKAVEDAAVEPPVLTLILCEEKPPMIETAMIGKKTQTIHLGTRPQVRANLHRPMPVATDLSACSLALRAIEEPHSLTPAGEVRGGTVEAVWVRGLLAVDCAPSSRTVSVYSSTPSPKRQPQARQKRNSRGIGV